MKVLWLCNIMLPKIAEYLNIEASNKEGWLSGTYEKMCQSNFMMPSGEKIELGVCFPVSDMQSQIEVELKEIKAFGFYENTNRPEIYEMDLEERLKRIVEKFKPDLVHCFGTEYPHTLAMTKVFPYPDKILIGIQGLCSECAKVYMANLPHKIQNSRTFRDLLKQDCIKSQQQKFAKRGKNEIQALKNTRHVTGRTVWDYMCVRNITDTVKYHFMNETLRSNFYEDKWDYRKCTPYSIFMSQGDYPLKGLHFMLQAMSQILEKFPQTTLWIAGNDITKTQTMKEKLKISGYGKYLRKLMKKNQLQNKVHFLGKLSAEDMKTQFLNSNLYVCTSVLENSPNSLGEAMLLGMPSVASKVGGIPTMFTDKKDGILFESGNVTALAEAVIDIFTNVEDAKIYGQNARVHALSTHDADKNYARLLEVYEEIACK